MANDKKDTIYIDVDDEITAVIDKLDKSDSKIVALVLPKRTAALQSIVNMKLLKRAADESGKSPVLITSEKGLLPLAGATGLHVAKNLNSKPEIPPSPDSKAVDDEELEAELEAEEVDSKAAVGALAGAAAAKAAKDDDIDMSEEADAAAASASLKAEPGKKGAKGKGKKGAKGAGPKIPNFEQFRKKIFIIGGAILAAVALFVLAVVVLPKATIIIETNTESIDTTFDFTASPSASELDESASVVPAKLATEKVNETQTAPATGQKDIGNKASGTVNLSAKVCGSFSVPNAVPAGTTVSSNGANFVTGQSVSFSPGTISGGCINFNGGNTTVTATGPGANYNVNNANFTVSGRSDVTGTGSTNGGSSNIVKVVTAQDVETAKAKIAAKDDVVKKNLQQQLESDNYFVIQASFKKSNESTTPSPAVDQEASEVKVTYTADYTMMGVERDDMKALIKQSLKDEIDVERQAIQEDGLEQATFTVKSTADDGDTVMTVSTKAEVGPDIDTEALKNEVLGKKRGETENIVKELPGVKSVEVDYSPFWVSRTPKAAKKITIEFKSANQ